MSDMVRLFFPPQAEEPEWTASMAGPTAMAAGLWSLKVGFPWPEFGACRPTGGLRAVVQLPDPDREAALLQWSPALLGWRVS